MARRTAGRAVPPTEDGRAAHREKDARSPGAWAAFSWSVVLILSALCCGYCGADTEFSILEEAQVLAEQMKKLSSQELGVFTMQVRKAFLNVPNVELCPRWSLYDRWGGTEPAVIVAGITTVGNFDDVSSTITFVWFCEVRMR